MKRTGRKQRTLRNIRLTRSYHWRYMGLWIVLTVLLCGVFTYVCYRVIEHPAQRLYALSAGELDDYIAQRTSFLVWTTCEIVIVGGLLILLAIVTAHRMAGPYVRLCAAFNEVRDGNLDYRLKFRAYDHLDTVEEAFNAMMRALQAERAERQGDSGKTG